MSVGNLLIRADASVEMGTGHVVRCLALAQAWQDAGGKVVFALAKSTPAILARLAAENCETVSVPICSVDADDASCTSEFARARRADWIVLDGYHFDAHYQQQIKNSGRKVLCVDDGVTCACPCADLVLNQNVNATESVYRESSTTLLLGPQYALLRREFAKWRDWSRQIGPQARTALVTIGGSDPDGLTLKLLEAREFADLDVAFVLGGSAHEPPQVKPSRGIEFRRDVADIAQIMARSDLAVICGGGTLWECLFMGCATMSYTRNAIQDEIVNQLQEIGAVCHLGRIQAFERSSLLAKAAELAGSSKRQAMAQLGRQLVDGRGCERVLALMREMN